MSSEDRELEAAIRAGQGVTCTAVCATCAYRHGGGEVMKYAPRPADDEYVAAGINVLRPRSSGRAAVLRFWVLARGEAGVWMPIETLIKCHDHQDLPSQIVTMLRAVDSAASCRIDEFSGKTWACAIRNRAVGYCFSTNRDGSCSMSLYDADECTTTARRHEVGDAYSATLEK